MSSSTRTVATGFLIAILLGSFTNVSAQLPPEIVADKYLVHAELLHKEKDYEGAFKLMKKAIAFHQEHDLQLPKEFHFNFSRLALSADSIRIAHESVNKYLLATGKKGEFYKEALALFIKTEKELEFLDITPEKMCTGKPNGASCWMALSNPSDCHLWNPSYYDEAATWTGNCKDRVAHGHGTITFSEPGEKTYTGRVRNGRMHGRFTIGFTNGQVFAKGEYLNGDPIGTWYGLWWGECFAFTMQGGGNLWVRADDRKVDRSKCQW